MQVLSAMTPGAQELPGAGGVAFARGLNRWIAGEVVSRRPDRFRAFAVLPMQDPEAGDVRRPAPLRSDRRSG